MKTGYVITKEIFTGENSAPEVEYIAGVAYDYYYYAHKTKIIEG